MELARARFADAHAQASLAKRQRISVVALEHLVLEGRAERHREDGKLIYTVAPAS